MIGSGRFAGIVLAFGILASCGQQPDTADETDLVLNEGFLEREYSFSEDALRSARSAALLEFGLMLSISTQSLEGGGQVETDGVFSEDGQQCCVLLVTKMVPNGDTVTVGFKYGEFRRTPAFTTAPRAHTALDEEDSPVPELLHERLSQALEQNQGE